MPRRARPNGDAAAFAPARIADDGLHRSEGDVRFAVASNGALVQKRVFVIAGSRGGEAGQDKRVADAEGFAVIAARARVAFAVIPGRMPAASTDDAIDRVGQCSKGMHDASVTRHK
jgi:hypothetical protein